MAMEVTRRTFLKGMGALGALGVVGSLGGSGLEVFTEARAKEISGTKEIKGMCMMCKHSGCSNIVTVTNGVVTSVRGNPERVANKGSLCPRGKNAIYHHYNPYRVKAPMKRTNPEKGPNVDPGWMEISWDEALDTVAEKLREIYERDPRELLYFYGFAMSELTMNGIGKYYYFPVVFGTPNVSSTKGQFCAIHIGVSMLMNNMPTITADYASCEYLINIGRGTGMGGAYASGSARGMQAALDRGMKFYMVDPVCHVEASKGEWVPILPGTDLPFLLAMTHVMLHELDQYDKEFVRDRTNAPYLLNAEGDYYRSANGRPMVWEMASNTAKEWNDPTLDRKSVALMGEYTVNGAAVRPAFVDFYNSYKDYTPEWAEAICTVPAAKIREMTKGLVEHAHIGATIEIDGHTFPYRPAAVLTSRGVSNHEDGAMADFASKLIDMLLGNFYVPGGAQGTGLGNRIIIDKDGVLEPGYEAVPQAEFSWPPQCLDFLEFFPHRHSTNTLMLQAIAEGVEKWGFEYSPKALLVAGGNPIICNSQPEMAYAALKKIPFIVNIAYHLDEISQMSDILLAAPSMLESEGIVDYFGDENSMSSDSDDYIVGQTARLYRNPVDMLYDCREPNDLMIELCARISPMLLGKLNQMLNVMSLIGDRPVAAGSPLMGTKYQLDPGTRYTFAELIDRSFKNQYGEEYGLDYLKEHSFIDTYSLKKKEVYPSYYNDTVRYQLYLQTHKKNGEKLTSQIAEAIPDLKSYLGISLEDFKRHYSPIPVYIPDMKIHTAPEEYDLYATTCRVPMSIFRLGALDHNPWVLDWNNKYNPLYNSVLLNPVAAEKHGLKEGDYVTVESQFGKTSGRLHVTSIVHERSCVIPGALGRADDALGKQTSSQVCFNKLLCGKLGYVNPIHGGLETTCRVKVYKG